MSEASSRPRPRTLPAAARPAAILAATLLATAPAATAAEVGFAYNAGPVVFVDVFDPFLPAALLDFLPGEDVIVSITIDLDTPAEEVSPTEVWYSDPAGTIVLTGAVSGAEATMVPGVRLELENLNEVDLSTAESAFDAPVSAHDLFLLEDIDYRSDTDFLTDRMDLPGSLAEIAALFATGVAALPNVTTGWNAEVWYADSREGAEAGTPLSWEDAIPFFAMEFGPVPPTIPVPATLPLLAGGLAAVGLLRRRG